MLVSCFCRFLLKKHTRIDLLALRNAESKPSDPVAYLQDYFGKYRDPAWDEVVKLKSENHKLAETLPILHAKIAELEKNLEHAKILARIPPLFAKFEKDKTDCIPMKSLYKALCGNPKFDVNLALNASQFKEFVKSLAPAGDMEALREKISVLEKAAQGETPFAGALDNPTFAGIVEGMRKYKPEWGVAEAIKKSGKPEGDAKKA